MAAATAEIELAGMSPRDIFLAGLTPWQIGEMSREEVEALDDAQLDALVEAWYEGLLGAEPLGATGTLDSCEEADLPDEPTNAAPGTPAKEQVFQERISCRFTLHHPKDRKIRRFNP